MLLIKDDNEMFQLRFAINNCCVIDLASQGKNNISPLSVLSTVKFPSAEKVLKEDTLEGALKVPEYDKSPTLHPENDTFSAGLDSML